MKRIKFILWVVVAAMVLMGAGYAAWSQTFTISSTVNTGELFVEIKNTQNLITAKDEAGNGVASYLNADDLVVTPTYESSGQNQTLSTLTFNITDMYPGVEIASTLTFTNLGTMKTKVPSVELSSTNPNSLLWKDLRITLNGTVIKESGKTTDEGNLQTVIANLIGELEPTGVEKTVTLVQELPLSSQNTTEKLTLQWNMGFLFEQYNAPSQTQQ